ncbi:MAG: YeeE/YedE thiosulfate transporter family protein [Pseudomonadota bacterium]
MTIIDFTPVTGLLGGLMIGLAAIILLLGSGRIAGVSGVLAGAMGQASAGDRQWRWFFLAGLVIGGLLYLSFNDFQWGAAAATPAWPVLIGALLVGFGTRMGNGCTSGHGICGISRFSVRSVVATLTFMVAGFITVFVARHVIA